MINYEKCDYIYIRYGQLPVLCLKNISLTTDQNSKGVSIMINVDLIPIWLYETNITKNETEYKVSMSVPGLTKEDIKITTKEGVLKISYEKTEGDKTHHFIGGFVKSYSIPDDVREKDILGKVENGVLELVLPIDRKKSLERQISLN